MREEKTVEYCLPCEMILGKMVEAVKKIDNVPLCLKHSKVYKTLIKPMLNDSRQV